jgi:hypothetical protein
MTLPQEKVDSMADHRDEKVSDAIKSAIMLIEDEYGLYGLDIALEIVEKRRFSIIQQLEADRETSGFVDNRRNTY